MLGIIQQELEKRAEFYRNLDIVFNETFSLDLGNVKKRIRRNKVHEALLGPIGARKGNWRTKRLVCEYLKAKGIRFLLTTGRRYFTGLEFKDHGK